MTSIGTNAIPANFRTSNSKVASLLYYGNINVVYAHLSHAKMSNVLICRALKLL